MSFDFTTLITDRTQADVDRVKAIAKKIENGTASESELAEFNGAAMKGAYNYTDLNRVTAAMDALKTKLEGYGYAVPGYQRIKIDHVIPGASRLPEGYTELQYIESTGTQYIDTDFAPNQDTKIMMVAEPVSVANVSASGGFAPYGAGNTSTDRAFELYSWNSKYNPNYDGQTITTGTAATGKKLTITQDKNVFTLVSSDGTTVSHTFTYNSFTTPYTLTLFAVHRASLLKGLQKIYSCQLYDNDTLVRNYVPCINPSGVVGLYDTVNDAFYQNAGTGAFTAGEEIVPPADVPVVDEFDPYLWYEFDWPAPETMTIYLLNVSVIRSVLTVMASTPKVPSDMVELMVTEANDIEVILLDVYRQINIMATTFIPCGEALCGGDNL